MQLLWMYVNFFVRNFYYCLQNWNFWGFALHGKLSRQIFSAEKRSRTLCIFIRHSVVSFEHFVTCSFLAKSLLKWSFKSFKTWKRALKSSKGQMAKSSILSFKTTFRCQAACNCRRYPFQVSTPFFFYSWKCLGCLSKLNN